MEGEGVNEICGYGHKGSEETETDETGANDGGDPVGSFLGGPAVEEYFGACQYISIFLAFVKRGWGRRTSNGHEKGTWDHGWKPVLGLHLPGLPREVLYYSVTAETEDEEARERPDADTQIRQSDSA